MNRKSYFIAAAFSLLTAAACSAPAPATAPSVPAAASTVSASAPTVLAGTFSGRSDHVTTGAVTITGSAGNYTLTLGTDFTLDGAPDPVVGFGRNGTYDAASKVSPLKSNAGEQSYTLPASFDPANVSEVYIWCEQFNVPLGVAEF